MKRKGLLLAAVAAFLAVGNVMAGTTVTKTFHFPLSSAEKTWGGDNLTINADEGSFTYNGGVKNDTVKNEDGTQTINENVYVYGNAAAGWTIITDISDYTNLVLELSEATTANIEIVVANGGFWGMENNYQTYLTKGETKISMPIAQMTKNGSTVADGSALDLTKVDLVFLRTGWVHEQTIKIKDFYLEKVVTDATSDDTKEISITDHFATSYDLGGETDYKYLVIVPTEPYVENVSNQFLYNLTDGTNSIQDWGFAYGFYQQRRATVINLTDKVVYNNSDETFNTDSEGNKTDVCKDFSSSEIDMTKLTALNINADNSVNDGTLDISAIYFTNEKPTYSNQWNYPVSKQEYMREATAAGTWGTICLSYNTAICGAYAYKVVGVDSKDAPSKLYLERVNGLLKAGVPYVFKTTTDKVGDFQEGNVTFYKAGATTVTSPENNALEGNLSTASVSVPEDSYVLTSDGTWGKGTGNTVGQNKAYLTLTDDIVVSAEEAATAKYIVMDIEGGSTTGINAAKAAVKADGAIYNLNGVRVSNPTKGLYIQNGKKFIVK